MPETETTQETTETKVEAESQSTQAETQTPADPQEERLDRIVAQRLGKYAARTERAESESRELRERVANLEGRVQERQAQTPQTTQQYYTHEQLQSAVDSGRITPAAMAQQLAWQQKEAGKQELRQEFKQESVRDAAAKEVREYLDKLPVLSGDTPEFHKVRTSAAEISDEMGLPVTDPRVQRRALREVFGTPDKLAKISAARDFDRANADRHTEMGGGGGRPVESKKDDPLKQVGETWLNYWKPRVTPEKLKELAYREIALRSTRRTQR